MSQFVLPKLDYEMDALAPAISKETLDKPGFGVELNRECGLERPYTH